MNKSKGFTLIELMVVISIIAILSVIGITIFSGVSKNARDGKRRADMLAISSALEQYKLANGSYPVCKLSATGGLTWCISTTGGNWITDTVSGTSLTSYFSAGSQPQDPINNGWFSNDPLPTTNPRHYGYAYYSSNGSWYMLVVALENPTSGDLATQCGGYAYGTLYAKNTRMICNQQ